MEGLERGRGRQGRNDAEEQVREKSARRPRGRWKEGC